MAEELGFDGIHLNSMNAVADRDFVLDAFNWGSLLLALLTIQALRHKPDDWA